MNKYLKAVTANEFFFLLNTIAFLVLTPLAIRFMGEEFYGVWRNENCPALRKRGRAVCYV